jgi:ectoine hydroxylase-related dioxygenase (phytanoyl-CoA dioxygenase family)
MPDFDAAGFAVIPAVISQQICGELADKASLALHAGGSRGLLDEPWCASVATQIRRHAMLSALIPDDHVAVQCTYFEKSVDRNWLVPVHQDLSIPVAERISETSLRGWSEKEGALFVQAPPQVLKQIVAVRLHLDDCLLADGPLRVVPGSHSMGVLSADAAIAMRDAYAEVCCEVEQGGVLVMRPLLLHASSKSSGSSRRRVLHFVFGPPELPLGLRWRTAVVA